MLLSDVLMVEVRSPVLVWKEVVKGRVIARSQTSGALWSGEEQDGRRRNIFLQ